MLAQSERSIEGLPGKIPVEPEKGSFQKHDKFRFWLRFRLWLTGNKKGIAENNSCNPFTIFIQIRSDDSHIHRIPVNDSVFLITCVCQ